MATPRSLNTRMIWLGLFTVLFFLVVKQIAHLNVVFTHANLTVDDVPYYEGLDADLADRYKFQWFIYASDGLVYFLPYGLILLAIQVNSTTYPYAYADVLVVVYIFIIILGVAKFIWRIVMAFGCDGWQFCTNDDDQIKGEASFTFWFLLSFHFGEILFGAIYWWMADSVVRAGGVDSGITFLLKKAVMKAIRSDSSGADQRYLGNASPPPPPPKNRPMHTGPTYPAPPAKDRRIVSDAVNKFHF